MTFHLANNRAGRFDHLPLTVRGTPRKRFGNYSDAGKTHGMSRRADGRPAPEYSTWRAMKRRCRDTKRVDFHRYGGRGIDYCDAWSSFESFLADMGPRPRGTSLDRVDNSNGYCKANCRWASHAVQQRNRRDNVFHELLGESKCEFDWARDPRGAVSADCFRSRMRFGWDPLVAFTKPSRQKVH